MSGYTLSITSKKTEYDIKDEVEVLLAKEGNTDWRIIWTIVFFDCTNVKLQMDLTTKVIASAVAINAQDACFKEMQEVCGLKNKTDLITRDLLENSKEYLKFLDKRFKTYLEEAFQPLAEKALEDMSLASMEELSKLEAKFKRVDALSNSIHGQLEDLNSELDETRDTLDELLLETDVHLPTITENAALQKAKTQEEKANSNTIILTLMGICCLIAFILCVLILVP